MRVVRKDRKSIRARRAIDYLFSKLREYPADAKRIIAHARAYSTRHRVPITSEERLLYCPHCHEAYGAEAKRRVRGASIYVHCDSCGGLRRLRARTSAKTPRAPRTRSAKT